MKGNGTKILIVILIILILAAGSIMAYKIVKDKQNKEGMIQPTENQAENILTAPVEEIGRAHV